MLILFQFGLNSMVYMLRPLGMSSYARVKIEFRAYVEIKENIVVVMPKITREGHYTCNVHVEYKWKPPRKWHPDENLLKEDVNTIPVWVKLYGVHVMAFSDDCLIAIASKLDTPLMLDSYTSDYVHVILGEGHYTCNVHVEYKWKPPRCSSCKVFGHIHEECPKNTGVGKKKIVKKPSQASRGALVGPKMPFKSQKEYRPVIKNPNTSSSGNKKKCVKPTIEAIPSGFSFMNTDNDGEFASNTPIGEKINKIERQIGEGKLRLLDHDENPLVSTGIVESNSGVEVGSYPDNNDYDPYDDYMYKNHDLSEHLQSICDDLDITVCGKKKK
nr:hypothetical protein [Tanacetum cinerariifolium]